MKKWPNPQLSLEVVQFNKIKTLVVVTEPIKQRTSVVTKYVELKNV